MHIPKSIKGGTVIDFLTAAATILLIIASFLYFPIALDQMRLDELMGELTLQKKGIKEEALITALVEEAERKYNIILFEEDVFIDRYGNVMELTVIWRPLIVVPILDYEIELRKEMVRERITL